MNELRRESETEVCGNCAIGLRFDIARTWRAHRTKCRSSDLKVAKFLHSSSRGARRLSHRADAVRF